MRERITQTGESIGSSVIWAVALFSLLVFSAPLTWVGESLSDLRWHVGSLALVLSIVGMTLLPRKRVAFFCTLCLAVYNLFPAMRVFLPSTANDVLAGTEVTVVQVRWEEDPTDSLEARLNSQLADLAVVTGVDSDAIQSLKENLVDWPYSMSSPTLEMDGGKDAHSFGTIVFSKYPLDEPEVITFAENTIFMEAQINIEGPPVHLRVVSLPPPGPGDREHDREALLMDLETRSWDLRTILAIDLGASDTSMAYDRVRGLGGLADARQGIGRQATFKASFGGFALPGVSMPRDFTFVGGEIGVIDRFSESVTAIDRERPLYQGADHSAITTRLRIVN
jgi:hypothetical protein